MERPLERLTFAPGMEIDPTWSGDGGFIAYASDASGNFDVRVQQREPGAEPLRLTDSPAHDWQPAWSPGGDPIASRSGRDGGGLFVAPPLGGPARRLASLGYEPQWSPDGTRIVFRSTPEANLRGSGGLGSSAFVVGLDGRPPTGVRGVEGFVHIDGWAGIPMAIASRCGAPYGAAPATRSGPSRSGAARSSSRTGRRRVSRSL